MKFNKNQEKAINFYEGNVNVLATAGSGKTSVLVHRIANLVQMHRVHPDNILAITFSKKTKDNMIKKLSEIIPYSYSAINVETFHSWGLRLLRKFKGTNFNVLSNDVERLKILQTFETDIENPNDVLSYISLRKNNLQLPVTEPCTYLERMYLLYEKEKERQNTIDYDDMLTKAYELIKENPSAFQYCVEQFKFVLMDESQDVNMVQMKLLELIGKPNNNTFIVGDVLQCIYNFRSADNKHVRNFHKEWDNVTVINLDTNYRSTKNIVDFSNDFARHIEDSNFKFYKNSTSHKGNYKDPELTMYDNEFVEAFGVADKIKELVSTGEYGYKDFAVLSRTNAKLQLFETTFYNEGLPCGITDGLSFVDRKEIKVILNYLKLANDLDNNDAFRYIYWQPLRGLGKAFLKECETVRQSRAMTSLYKAMFKLDGRKTRYVSGIEEIRYITETLKNNDWNNVGEMIKHIRRTFSIDMFVSKEIGSAENNDSNERTENLDSLEQIASQFKTLSEFLQYIKKFSNKKEISENSITLSTIHRSKGLEFPVVFLIGIDSGVLPHKRNMNVEEEKRLCYVGITRAERELFCSSTDKNSLFVKLLFNEK